LFTPKNETPGTSGRKESPGEPGFKSGGHARTIRQYRRCCSGRGAIGAIGVNGVGSPPIFLRKRISR
jgi:hypothetical protein